jgi:hypothetical protein
LSIASFGCILLTTTMVNADCPLICV